MILLQLENLPEYVETDSALKRGGIVDTNVLFAGSFSLDTFNEWAGKVFQNLLALSIPVFTNINVRISWLDNVMK
jgi:hypothetical protein